MELSPAEASAPASLRERKQARTRSAIIDAAFALFAGHGFDDVTVTAIAERAQIGRSTFFRYFTDKQEVLFAEDPGLLTELTAATEAAAVPLAPVGDSLARALIVIRAGLRTLTRQVSSQPGLLALRARLIAANPSLRARELVKQQGYVTLGVQVLTSHGATVDTALLAASIGAACYSAGQARALQAGLDLTAAVDDAFARVASLDTTELGSA